MEKNKAFIGTLLSPEYTIDVLWVTSVFKATAIRVHKSQYSHPRSQFMHLTWESTFLIFMVGTEFRGGGNKDTHTTASSACGWKEIKHLKF